MAPELKKLKGDEKAVIDGFKADIYSLGICMLSLVFPSVKEPIKLIKRLIENI